MKINVTTKLLGYNGKPMKTQDTDMEKLANGQYPERDFLVRDAIITSLNTMLPEEQMPAETKIRVHYVSQKVFLENEPELNVDELHLIKERAGKILTPVAFGSLAAIIDPKSEKTKTDDKAK